MFYLFCQVCFQLASFFNLAGVLLSVMARHMYSNSNLSKAETAAFIDRFNQLVSFYFIKYIYLNIILNIFWNTASLCNPKPGRRPIP